MTDVYLSLGSNIGNREGYLKKALYELSKRSMVIKSVSPIYETEPIGYKEQGKFLNIAILVETKLSPHELLNTINSVENSLGRERIIRWGPRTIDIDILLYGAKSLNDNDLIIPHQRMWERAFVLIPLKDINPNITKDDVKVEELINALPDKDGVKLYKKDWYKVE
ncbi:2-amino-4-hydroxy-6-hydroxymethyldihydropteridine diphosphokinase [Thermoanaerobacterium sp. RBIITD]|uniref:2-amino-4-hydroxy-6- hydroxymethyldihydropteridine diphosphokinase n=1 Tax=Thermoanaerobacterium sp. RBIITD TaxID=1550240 RepID=UPI000BB8F43B|nr:2-amino-4-hydroxy-6-hydroxymethyldihydropteridine diphosphokinase [Thermoanaerobacterium sp. RBIITD]SNX54314.1 2-amino-4-hydroxy-6-hydroxymethyldihydropteridinediphosphokinase [Thermoanaerobacterium sp. RBIITD]